jgi:hypothetical protein
MAYWSYCFVVIWFVTQFRMGKNLLLCTAPWYSKRTITFSDMLAAAQRCRFTPGISREPRKHHSSPKTISARFTPRPDTKLRSNGNEMRCLTVGTHLLHCERHTVASFRRKRRRPSRGPVAIRRQLGMKRVKEQNYSDCRRRRYCVRRVPFPMIA